MRKVLVIILGMLLLLSGCGEKEDAAKDVVIEEGMETTTEEKEWKDYTFDAIKYSVPASYDGTGEIEDGTTVIFYMDNSMLMITKMNDLGDITDSSIQEFIDGLSYDDTEYDNDGDRVISGKKAFEITGNPTIDQKKYSVDITTLENENDWYSFCLYDIEGENHGDDFNDIIASIKCEDTEDQVSESENDAMETSESNYLDAVRANLSRAGVTLSPLDKGEDGKAKYFTFTNSKDSVNGDYECIVTTYSNDAGLLDSIILKSKNTGWLYVYAYCVIGSLDGQEGLDAILSEMMIDKNNGFTGTELAAYTNNGHDYSVHVFDDEVLIAIYKSDD